MTESLHKPELPYHESGIKLALPQQRTINFLNSLLEHHQDGFSTRQVPLACVNLPDDYPISALNCSFVARAHSLPQKTGTQNISDYELVIDLVLRQPQQITEAKARNIRDLLHDEESAYRTLPNGRHQVLAPVTKNTRQFLGQPVSLKPLVIIELGHDDPKRGLMYLEMLRKNTSAGGPIEKRMTELEETQQDGELLSVIRLRLADHDIYSGYIDHHDNRRIHGQTGTLNVGSKIINAFLKKSGHAIEAVCNALGGKKKRSPVTINLAYSENNITNPLSTNKPISPKQERLRLLKERMQGLTPNQQSLLLDLLGLYAQIVQLAQETPNPKLPEITRLFNEKSEDCINAGIPSEHLVF